jgi:hypothetical protein
MWDDDAVYRALMAGARVALRWGKANLSTILAAAVLCLVFRACYLYRVEIAGEMGRIRGAYDRERARELQRARDYGQSIKPPAPEVP